MSIPYIKKAHAKKILMVHDKPFIMLAGEVHNSNSSSVAYMEQVWDKADSLGMNSLLLPISWEMVEPEEGVFDFSLVDGLVNQARRRGKKLGLLWFGAWKNAQCYYAPSWVKTDLNRFKRAEIVKGKNKISLDNYYGMSYTSLSYLCEETKKADTKAFRAFMKHLKNIDESENTVVIVQVENETGIMGSGRENSDYADALFASDVPSEFIEFMKAHVDTMAKDVSESVKNGKNAGPWKDVFGDNAEEIFSAYHISGYVNEVATAGKEEYPLPMVANCWLDKGQKPGDYPTGGPVARMMEVWKYRAPSIDVIAPDIYVPNFCDICDEYTKLDNPLFIPETAIHSYAGPRQVYTIGHYHGMCYAPFGFEGMGEPIDASMSFLFGVDNTDPALATPQNTDEYSWYTKTLNNLLPVLTSKYGTANLQAVCSERKEQDTMVFGDYGFKVRFDLPMIKQNDGVCLVVKGRCDNEFYIIVNRCAVSMFSANEEAPHIDILSLEDGVFENGIWHMSRRLNGDEAAITLYHKPTLLKMKLFTYR